MASESEKGLIKTVAWAMSGALFVTILVFIKIAVVAFKADPVAGFFALGLSLVVALGLGTVSMLILKLAYGGITESLRG